MTRSACLNVRPLIALIALPLVACATITSGPRQSILVESEPAGAQCELRREGEEAVLAVVGATPATVEVARSDRGLVVLCTKNGHEPGRVAVASGVNELTYGNIVLGGWVGAMVDQQNKADRKYPERISVALTPGQNKAAPAMAVGSAPATATVFIPRAPDDDSAIKRLVALKSLFDQGLITRDDYDRRRKEILDSY